MRYPQELLRRVESAISWLPPHAVGTKATEAIKAVRAWDAEQEEARQRQATPKPVTVVHDSMAIGDGFTLGAHVPESRARGGAMPAWKELKVRLKDHMTESRALLDAAEMLEEDLTESTDLLENARARIRELERECGDAHQALSEARACPNCGSQERAGKSDLLLCECPDPAAEKIRLARLDERRIAIGLLKSEQQSAAAKDQPAREDAMAQAIAVLERFL